MFLFTNNKNGCSGTKRNICMNSCWAFDSKNSVQAPIFKVNFSTTVVSLRLLKIAKIFFTGKAIPTKALVCSVFICPHTMLLLSLTKPSRKYETFLKCVTTSSWPEKSKLKKVLILVAGKYHIQISLSIVLRKKKTKKKQFVRSLLKEC